MEVILSRRLFPALALCLWLAAHAFGQSAPGRDGDFERAYRESGPTI